jgi:ABC-type iron transport system FetAB permease component
VHLLLAFLSATTVVLLYAAGLILPSVWWGDPRYVVPAAVVALAQAVICVAAGLSAEFASLIEGGDPVRLYATRLGFKRLALAKLRDQTNT